MSNDNWHKWIVKITTDIKNYCEQYEWCLQYNINRFQNNVINISALLLYNLFQAINKPMSNSDVDFLHTQQIWTHEIYFCTYTWRTISNTYMIYPDISYTGWNALITQKPPEMTLMPLMHIVPSIGPSEEKGWWK